jgi:hypothetical protein
VNLRFRLNVEQPALESRAEFRPELTPGGLDAGNGDRTRSVAWQRLKGRRRYPELARRAVLNRRWYAAGLMDSFLANTRRILS